MGMLLRINKTYMPEETVKTGIEVPKALLKRIRVAVAQRDLMMKDAAREAFELWLTGVEPQVGYIPVTARIPTDIHEALLEYGKAHHLSIEQIVLRALDLVLQEAEPSAVPPTNITKNYAIPQSLESSTPFYDSLRSILNSGNQRVISLLGKMVEVALDELDAEGGSEARQTPKTKGPDIGPRPREQPDKEEKRITEPALRPIRRRKEGAG